MRNDGVYVGGNARVSAGAIAVGSDASAVNVTAADHRLDDVRHQLDALVEALQAAALPDGRQLAEAAQQARAELDKPAPNKVTMLGILQGVAAGVGSAAGLATSVSALIQAVGHLL